jgi:hypothetical protein
LGSEKDQLEFMDARSADCFDLARTSTSDKEISMPRYVVNRTFPDGLEIPINPAGAEACGGVIARNLEDDVSWVHSYVSLDKKQTWCIYDAPTPEAIRRAAGRNGLPIAAIAEVRVLDPYFYMGEGR